MRFPRDFIGCTAAHWAIIVLVVAGCALRIAAARGGLWIDEAWSAVYAADAGTPLGVFLSINHDNNHHLNSLWMQAVGLSAPSLLVRGLSIAASTAAIGVAAAIGWRRGPAQAVILAALFAFSPILVNYGSEARGYAAMVLAMLGAVFVVDRWLDDPAKASPALALGVVTGVGMLANLTFMFMLPALAGWVLICLARTGSFRTSLDKTIRLMLPSLATAVIVVVIVIGAAAASETGMQVGGYHPYRWSGFLAALDMMTTSTLGMPPAGGWPFAFAVFATIVSCAVVGAVRQRMSFYLLSIIAFPGAILVLQMANSEFARYYLLCAVALLLLIAEVSAAAISAGGWRRVVVIILLVAMFGGAARENLALVRSLRGDLGASIEAMARISPNGASVFLNTDRPTAVLRVAAAQRGYPLTMTTRCPAAPFLFIEQTTITSLPPIRRCRQTYVPLVSRDASRLSGVPWAVYRLAGD